MDYIECMQLRASKATLSVECRKVLRDIMTDAKDEEEITAVSVLENTLNENDIAILIYWKGEPKHSGKSIFGLHVVEALKRFGIINHDVWKEMK
jgi:hypothetical protein